MMKIKDGEGKDTWAFYEIKSGPGFADDTPDVREIGSAECVTCHETGKDFIKGTAP